MPAVLFPAVLTRAGMVLIITVDKEGTTNSKEVIMMMMIPDNDGEMLNR